MKLDIAPRYSGVIYGLGNSFGVVSGIMGVALTGWILDVTGRNWDIVWNLSATLYLTGTFVFVRWVGERVVVE